MEIRDALEPDRQAVAEVVGTSVPAAARMIRERTVRVATGGDRDHIRGVVSFDVSDDSVRITRLAGDPEAYGPLLEEPLRYAERESMAVESVVPRTEPRVREHIETRDFESVGPGPTFHGTETVRYRRGRDG